jgi:hypothetical protein
VFPCDPKTVFAGWSSMGSVISGDVSAEECGAFCASVVLLPPRPNILGSMKAYVCSLMNTFVFPFATQAGDLRRSKFTETFKRGQPICAHEFSLRMRTFL